MNLIYDNMTIEENILELLYHAGNKALEYEKIDPENVEVSLTFAGKDEIQSINREYRNIDKATDVLSFPQYESIEEIKNLNDIILGDVVICTEIAHEQAIEYGHSYEREITYLFVHSMFHLMGYDHMNDEEKMEMREAEESVMSKMSLLR